MAALRPGAADDEARADYVIEADAKHWRRMLSGHTDPIVALMRRKLRLRKGKLGFATGQFEKRMAAVERVISGDE